MMPLSLDGEKIKGIPAHSDYTIGWICVYQVELDAALAMLDTTHGTLPGTPDDSNTYTLGRIYDFNVVVGYHQTNDKWPNRAATLASNMKRTFPSIQLYMVVGVGSGIGDGSTMPGNLPPANGEMDLRLGDVVVGTMATQFSLEQTAEGDRFRQVGATRTIPERFASALSRLYWFHESEANAIPALLALMVEEFPAMESYAWRQGRHDWLFSSTYEHVGSTESCEQCDKANLVQRSSLYGTGPLIHRGLIVSGYQAMRRASARDQLARDLKGLCIDNDAAEMMDEFPCVFIRGICDYSDSHAQGNKEWWPYAAATSAAFAKELLWIMEIPEEYSVDPATSPANNPTRKTVKSGPERLMDALRLNGLEPRGQTTNEIQPTTCEWLLEQRGFVDWLDFEQLDQTHGLLWLSGNPGTGKSMMAKFAFNQVEQRSTGNDVCALFLLDTSSKLSGNTFEIHKFLLLQLLQLIPDLQQVLETSAVFPYLYMSDDEVPVWTAELVQQVFSAALPRLEEQRVTFFVDTVDMCDRMQVQDMVQLFENLGQTAVSAGVRFRVCLLSCHYQDITPQHCEQLLLNDQVGHEEDLKKYIRAHLKGSQEYMNEVTGRLLAQAHGSFLYLRLIINILRTEIDRDPTFDILRKVPEIPSDLNGLFGYVLRRDDPKNEELLFCLQLLIFAKQSLTPEEYYLALEWSQYTDPNQFNQVDIGQVADQDISRIVHSSSRGLAEVTNSRTPRVEFIHELVPDFLIAGEGLRGAWPEIDDVLDAQTHERLKQCCIAYLRAAYISEYAAVGAILPKSSSSAAQDLRRTISNKFPFLKYATQNVLYHADEAAKKLPQGEFLKTFSFPTWIHVNNIFETRKENRYTQTESLLYIFAGRNLPRLINSLNEQDPNLNIHRARPRYPLFAALSNGHIDAARALLLQKGGVSVEHILANLDFSGNFLPPPNQTPLLWALAHQHSALAEVLSTSEGIELGKCGVFAEQHRDALSWAAGNGLEVVVLNLLQNDADIAAKDINGRTPLSWAAGNGHLSVVQLLLSKSAAEFDTADFSRATPLMWATKNGHVDVMRCLLDKDTDFERKDWAGLSLLISTAKEGREAALRLLLDRGADIEVVDRQGRTPLIWAAIGGHVGMTRKLLDEGARMEARDKNGRTPLMWAAGQGQLDALRVLLEHGADVEARDENGVAPLAWAAARGYEAVVRHLLKHSSAVDATDIKSCTPLLWAARMCITNTDIDAASLDMVGMGGPFSEMEKRIHVMMQRTSAAFLLAGDDRIFHSDAPVGSDISQNHKNVVQQLLSHGADAGVRDSQGRTPLWWAAVKGDEAMVQLLLESGADPEASDLEGKTPLSIATEYYQHGVTLQLESRQNEERIA